MFGSSPHTWGIPLHPRMGMNSARFIPTYVGHTEDKKHRVSSYYGSSPHTWGIRISCTVFIVISPVHPHIRGAYQQRDQFLRVLAGSSPHTWGIRRRTSTRTKPSRFIPTYVGHTRYKSIPVGRISVHPHIRGAYGRSGSCPSTMPGSSPHTWGIQTVQVVAKERGRFIPTYVGHTAG